MRKQKDLSKVIRNGLCIGCGACVVVEGGLQLQLNSETMMYEPSGSGGEAAASVCPSVQVDFEGLQKKLFPGEPFTSVGAVKSIMLAQSTNYERNLKASSGGIIKELLLEYLSRHEVDGAIALSHVEGLLFEPSLITRTEQVDMLPGSIYHNIPFDKALHLLGTNQGCYVLVAIPCQLEGIYNYIFKYRPELVERVYTAIGLICGWTYTHHSIKAICEFKGLDFDQIEAVAFRGGDPVGRLRIQLPRKKVEVNRRTDFDYIVAFARSFNTPRCHLCVNHVNFLADIVVGDAWLSSTANSKSGASIVICRTKEAVEVMQTLEEKGRIRRAEATEAEIVESQGRRFTYGDSSYAYADYLEAIGEFCPDMIGPNRSAAKLSSRRSVKRFHRENTRRIHLQRQGKYRYLRWRKVAVDLGKYVYRYLRKLLLRSSRSLLGRRSEIPTSDLRDFR